MTTSLNDVIRLHSSVATLNSVQIDSLISYGQRCHVKGSFGSIEPVAKILGLQLLNL